jgi:hypothetical protein
VKRVGRADFHGVNRGIGKHSFNVCLTSFHAEFIGILLSGWEVGVDDCGDIDESQAANRFQVNPADEAGSDYCCAKSLSH